MCIMESHAAKLKAMSIKQDVEVRTFYIIFTSENKAKEVTLIQSFFMNKKHLLKQKLSCLFTKDNNYSYAICTIVETHATFEWSSDVQSRDCLATNYRNL